MEPRDGLPRKGNVIATNSKARVRTAKAWGVHFLTATGAVAGLLAVISISQDQWRLAFAWMAAATFVDSIDGALARHYEVKETLPGFDGALLDNIVDYFTYVIVPAVFVYESGLVPHGSGLVAAALMALTSGYQFCQVDAKTDDHCFKGFPSYWNVVALYLFLLFQTHPWMNFAIIASLAVAVFVPIRYLYPSRTRLLRPLNLVLTLAWAILLGIAVVRFPEHHVPWTLASFGYVAYYLGVSLYLTYRARAAGTGD